MQYTIIDFHWDSRSVSTKGSLSCIEMTHLFQASHHRAEIITSLWLMAYRLWHSQFNYLHDAIQHIMRSSVRADCRMKWTMQGRYEPIVVWSERRKVGTRWLSYEVSDAGSVRDDCRMKWAMHEGQYETIVVWSEWCRVSTRRLSYEVSDAQGSVRDDCRMKWAMQGHWPVSL